ncbi:hypothetical protein [Kaistella sp.]|uniref:hypothetical protein n=1 Tax=Kaistella sp. TaxID=2782235 RepID=UPI003C3568AD
MLKQTLKKHLINSRGSRIDSKIVVFESDDWGSIRIPSKDVRKQLLERGLIKDTDAFSKYDALETSEDYFALYEVFRKFKDKNGNHPVLTANMILNNPDFKKIAEGKFETYYNEPFPSTYQKYKESENAFAALKEGIEQKLIVTQFHGNEHLNVSRWMTFLKEGNERYHFAFERNCFSIDEISSENRRGNLMAAYDYNNLTTELNYVRRSIADGLKQFEDLFGFKSQTTVAPCYVWDSEIEKVFYDHEVDTFQGSYVQNCPVQGKNFKKKYRYSGQVNTSGQRYFVRNGLFEPSTSPNVNWVEKCMESIAIAFKWGKPAIIGTHRINFASRLDEKQREQNLMDLESLLSQMLQCWPEIEFMDSASLVSIYK